MPIYRTSSTYMQTNDVEAASPAEARVVARGFALDPSLAEFVDVELLGEIDENGNASPPGQDVIPLFGRIQVIR